MPSPAKRNLLLLGPLLLFMGASATGEEPLLRPHDRVAICGDQISANQGYALHLADYLTMCQGVEEVDVAQFGWGAQTAETFLARIDTDLLPYKPNVVMTCFGMTDGGHKALDEQTAQLYRKATSGLVQSLKKGGVRTIILGSAKCVDSFHYHKDPAQAGLELIRKKVRELVIMANTNAHDNKVSIPWPTPIRYTFGVGGYISTGKALNTTPEENPVRFVYQHFGNEEHNALKDGRQSWDLTAAWLAVRGTGELWDETWGGHWNVDPKTGVCAWLGNTDENRTFIQERMYVPDVQKIIEAELARPPK